MFKPHVVLVLGLWMVAIGFLGVPSTWKIRLYVLTGSVLVILYLFRLGRETILRLAQTQPKSADTFTENGGASERNGSRKTTIET